jgi:hypothetical protein
LGARFRDDQRDRFADMTDFLARQQRLRCKGEGFAGLHVRLHGRPYSLQPIGVGVRAGECGEHARRSTCGSDVDARNSRMGMGRAQHDGVHQAIEPQVIEISAASSDETGILTSPRRITDH